MTTTSPTRDDADDAIRDEIRNMKIKDVKAELTSRGVRVDGLFEKDELIEALVEARSRAQGTNEVGAGKDDDDEVEGNDDDDIEAPATVPEDEVSASLRKSTLASARIRLSEFATSFAAEEEEEEEEEGWPTGFYTNLRQDPTRKRHRWERNAKGPVSSHLTDRLKTNPNFVLADLTEDEEENAHPESNAEEESKTKRAAAVAKETVTAPGRWLKKGLAAVTVGNKGEEAHGGTNDEPRAKGDIDGTEKKKTATATKVVRPSFELIGLDAFRVEQFGKGPKAAICKEDLIVRAGLRRRPTFVVNLIFPFGNVVLYYMMPDWVTTFRNVEEKESDPPDVKALKRFLSGDANYRAQRLQAYMTVAKAPLALRPFAPPKKEISVLLGALPLRWRQGGTQHAPSNKTRIVKHAVLEADVDLSTDPDARKISNVAERFMKLCTVDVALVIGELPSSDGNETKDRTKNDGGVDATKPSACVGMARLDRIDVSRGAAFPDEKN